MTRPRLSEEQQQQREQNARHDLEQLVETILKAASDICRDPKLLGRDRALAFGRGAFLLATIDRLSKVLLDHPDVDVRADRLIDLRDAIEAAAILAGGLKAPVAHRLRTAPFRAAKAAKDDQVDEVILKVAAPIRQRHPADGPYQIAPRAVEEINEQLKDRNLEEREPDTIARRLKELWSRCAPPEN
jgi:hypothetical protein